MRKIAFLLAIVMLLSVALVSCGDDTTPDTPDTPSNDTQKENPDKDKEENKEEEYVPMGYRYEKYAEEDRKIINKDTLDLYAATNFKHLNTENIKGIVIAFPEINDESMTDTSTIGINLATFGVVYVRVLTDRWGWGDAGVVRLADLVVDAIKDKYGLGDTTPIVSMGKGMGATSALLYTADSRHNITACAAEFPVADIERSFTREKSYTRTFVTSVYAYDSSLKDALQEISLSAKAKYMPNIPYYIVGGTNDFIVEASTLKKLVNELGKKSKDITLTMIDGAEHGATSAAESGKIEMFVQKQATAKVEAPEKKEYADKNVTAVVPEGTNAGAAYEKYAEADAEYINFENLSYYTRNNLKYVEGDIKGIVMEFPGLGGSSCLGGLVGMGEYSSDFAQECGKKGIAVMYMYCGPWSWGNKGVIRMADLVIDALKDHYNLPDDIPVVSTGGSMGGLGALMFTHGSRHNIISCMAACPCYDILGEYKSFDALKEFPRTYLSAIAAYDMPLTEGLKAITPQENIATMPKVPYYVVCNVEDECFDDEGMAVFVQKMKDAGHDVTFKVLPGTTHGTFTDEERVSYRNFIINSIIGE